MKRAIIAIAIFCMHTSYGQINITAPMISATTTNIANGSRNIIGTVGEITVIGKTGNLYLGSGFYRSNGDIGSSTGIQNVVKEATFNVYPNPFTDKLTISPQVDYAMFDLTGKQVYVSTMENDLSKLAAGTYVLQTGKESIRVVKVTQ